MYYLKYTLRKENRTTMVKHSLQSSQLIFAMSQLIFQALCLVEKMDEQLSQIKICILQEKHN